ncbi:MAG: hypothetical protein WAO19_00125 [Candidatus Kryptoniota bacterium]
MHQMYKKSGCFISDQGVGKQFSDLRAIPPRIQAIVHQIIIYRIPVRFIGKLTFEHGQEIDIPAYLNKDSAQADRRWVVPAYDLRFSLSDSSVGVGRYEVELDLDQYGQVLEMNLPNKNFSYDSLDSQDQSLIHDAHLPLAFKFLPLDTAIETSIAVAAGMSKTTDSLSTSLEYDSCTDDLYWVISFPQVGSRNMKKFFNVEVNVQDGNVEKTYETALVTVY